MPPLKDITNQKFGKLTVIERIGSDSSGCATWKCKCDCGKTIVVSGAKLKNNHTRSCGCYKGDVRITDLTGKRFGRLIAKEYLSGYPKRSAYWRCECECGNQNFIVRAESLKSGRTRSCGCLLREKVYERGQMIESGDKYGRLTVIERVYKPRSLPLYRCRCDCGTETIVLKSSLLGGYSKSCGCYKREVSIEMGKQNCQNLKKSPEIGYVEGTYIHLISNNKLPSHNTSGIKGVFWDSSKRKWRAEIQFKSKVYYLGRFDDINEAIAVRKEAEDRLHGSFLDWYEENVKPLPKRKNKTL